MQETSLLEFLGANVVRSVSVDEIPDQAEYYSVLREDGSFLSVWDLPEAFAAELRGACSRETPVYLEEECLLPWLKITVAWDEGMENYRASVRRPGYQMRGKRVTPEQAFEIIRRTDNFFRFEGGTGPDFLGTINFDSWWFSGNHFPRGYGWCRPDGRIGLDSITQKYPHAGEFAEEWGRMLMAFPFLELCIVLWGVNEGMGSEAGMIECGLHIHDGRIEVLSPQHAEAVFQRYENRWGGAGELYSDEACENSRKTVCDQEYLKRCLTANGQDAEAVLAEIEDSVKRLF